MRSSTNTGHTVLRLFVRPVRREPPEERDRLTLEAGRGVEDDHGAGGKRHVTILFADDWGAALADLGRVVDPSARRANVLVSGGGAERYLGRTIDLGGARVALKGVVRPCARMDEAAEGLKAALEPDSRGGVWGEVLRGGEVARGDRLLAAGPFTRIGHLELFVADPAEARAFYEEVLGFVVTDVQSGPFVWLRSGDLEILLRPGEGGRGETYRQAGSGIVLYTDDLPGEVARLESRGLVFRGVDDPGACPTFTDPDGHWFQLVDPSSY